MARTTKNNIKKKTNRNPYTRAANVVGVNSIMNIQIWIWPGTRFV